jgi:hypothetical protein
MEQRAGSVKPGHWFRADTPSHHKDGLLHMVPKPQHLRIKNRNWGLWASSAVE